MNWPAVLTLVKAPTSNVIYVGSFEAWTDVELVLDTARLLRDHSFHLFGNWIREVPASLPSNVYVHGPVQHRAIAGKMKACSVGLIPSAPQNIERMVEKPLKFYEYLAAGLGVAATRFGGKDLAPFAALGDDPVALAGAIEQAKSIPARYAAQIEETVRALSWENLVSQMLEGVE